MNLSFSSFKSTLYKNYGENPGRMLVHTGVLGWILSSLAQISAVLVNDKLSPEQKSFLIPQEFADAAINIISFYVITNSLKNFSSKLVSTGKLTTPHIKNFLAKNNFISKNPNTKDKVGNMNFDISKVANFDEISTDYKNFKNGVDVVASTLGSILSCNIVTPVLRNNFAAREQKKIIDRNGYLKKNDVERPRGISMSEFQNNVYQKYSGSMRI